MYVVPQLVLHFKLFSDVLYHQSSGTLLSSQVKTRGLRHAHMPNRAKKINLAMGYTHYWRGDEPFSDDKWLQIKTGTSTILDWCRDQGLELQFEHDGPHPEIVEDYQGCECIVFNGYGDQGLETFIFRKQPLSFACCKTNKKTYDLVVGLVLVHVALIAPGFLYIASDGNWEDYWQEIREAYGEIFGSVPDSIFAVSDDT